MKKDIYRASILAAAGIVLANTSGETGVISLANAAEFNQAYYSEFLTTYAVGWQRSAPIKPLLDYIAPEVPSGPIAEVQSYDNTEPFLVDDKLTVRRQFGADFKHVQPMTSTKSTVEVPNKGLSVLLDKDKIAVNPLYKQQHVEWLMERLMRVDALEALALMIAGATSNSSVWSSSADPDALIRTRCKAQADITGFRPTRVLFGDTAEQYRFESYRAQNNAGAYNSADLDVMQIAKRLRVQDVMYSDDRYQSGASKAEFLGAKVLLFTAQQNPSPVDPSNCKRYVRDTLLGGGRLAVYEHDVSAKLVCVTVEQYSLVWLAHVLGLHVMNVSQS